MQAIDFVVRTPTGRASRGQLNQADGKLVVSTDGYSDISLNIGRDDVHAYSRSGNDLVIELEDGREIIIEGLFDGNGGQSARLYFSEGGQIEEISFSESWGRTNHAHVGTAESVDGLVFEGGSVSNVEVAGSTGYEASASTSGSASAGLNTNTVTTWELNEGALLGGLLGVGALGLVGASGGGGGGGGDAETAPAAVSDDIRITTVAGGTDAVVNAGEMAAGPSISGVTEADTLVTVTVDGVVATTTSDANGNWTVTYNSFDLPAGEYTANVVATATGASGATLTATSTMEVDTITNVGINTSTIEGDGIVLASEAADGVNLTGNGQAGANVVVTLNGASQSTIVASDGTWTVNFSPANVADINDQMVVVSAEATDEHGNIASTTQTVRVDTVIDVAFDDMQIGDNVINTTEAQSPVTFTGTTNPGNHVIVDLNGVLHDATVASNGSWTVEFQPSQLPAAPTSITLIATATDALGNSTTDTHNVSMDSAGFVHISSDVVEMDNIVNDVESQDGVTITGTTLPGSTVIVDFHSFTGEADVDLNGNWTIDIPAANIDAGTYSVDVTATATSATGNISTDTSVVNVDTLVDALSLDPITGDNVINLVEYNGGVVASGVVEAGSTVNVTIHETTKVATVNADGTWTVTFDAGDFPSADYTAQVTVDATDAAGNTRSVTQTVLVDTVGYNLTLNPIDLGGDGVINGAEAEAGLTFGGTTVPGGEVTVEFNGTTHTVIAGPDGVWTITLDADDIGDADGIVPLIITTVDDSGNITTVSQDVPVDTEVSNVAFPGSVIAVDGIVNSDEAGAPLVIQGTAEVGADVVINIAGTDYPVAVGPDGNWLLELPAGTFGPGDYEILLLATITDAAGNQVTQTTNLNVDTTVSNFAVTSTSMDGAAVLNSFVAQTGINLSGTVEPGSTVLVTFADTTKTATVNASGFWTVSFAGDEVPIGEYSTDAMIVATDSAGNSSTLTSNFIVDTAIPDAPELTAITEGLEGVRSIALPFSDDSFVINSLSEDGTTAEIPTTVLHDTFRNELLFNFGYDLPDGTDLIVELNDDAGNTSSTIFVLDDNSEIDMGSDAFADFSIGAVDLAFAQDSTLTITAEQLEGLAEFSDNLLIRGEAGDTVNATGAVQTSEVEVIDGQSYDIYTLGTNGAYMLIDQDIDVIT